MPGEQWLIEILADASKAEAALKRFVDTAQSAASQVAKSFDTVAAAKEKAAAAGAEAWKNYDQEIAAVARLNAELQKTYDLTARINQSKFANTSQTIAQGRAAGRAYFATLPAGIDDWTDPIPLDQALSRRNSIIQKRNDEAQKLASQQWGFYDRDIASVQKLNTELERTYDLTGKVNSAGFANTAATVREGRAAGRAYFAELDKQGTDDVWTDPISLDQALKRRNEIIAQRNQEALDQAGKFNKNMANVMVNSGVAPGAMTFDQAFANKQYIEGRFGTAENFLGYMKGKGMEDDAQVLLASMSGVGVQIERNMTLWDKFAQKFQSHALLLPAYVATWGAVQMAIEAATNSFDNFAKAQKEQVLQSFYYERAGLGNQLPAPAALNMTGQSQTTMQYAIALAREYGANVLQVQEQIGLWIKQTHDLDAALAMTNEALKVQMDTGMPLEDLYRSTLGVLSQYHEPLSKTNELFDVAIGLAAKYAGGLQMLGGEGQDAASQIVHGMDTASAVMAKFGLSFEQAGALVVTQLQTLAKEGGSSGESIGSNIASALDALEKGAAYKALDELGIKLENNSKLIDQLAEDWNKATSSGKTLGDTLGQVVRPGQYETLLNIVHQYKLYTQAVEDAKKAEQGHVSDDLANRLFGTVTVQLKQVESGFQAVGMQLGQAFLPTINNVVKFLNNDLIPTLLKNSQNLVNLGGDVVKTIGIFLGFKALSFLPTLFTGIVDAVAGVATAFVDAGAAMATAWSGGSAAVIAADDAMQASMATTAEKAQIAASAIGSALLKSIPVIGMVLTGVMLAKTGVDAINAHQDQVELSDPEKWIKFHTSRMAYDEQQMSELNSMSQYGASPAELSRYQEDYNMNMDRIKWIQKNRPDNAKKAASDSLDKIWEDLKREMLAGWEKLKGIYPTPPGGPTDQGSGAGATGSPKGMAKDYEDFRSQLGAFDAAADMTIEKYKGMAAAADVHISNLERELKLNPTNLDLLNQMTAWNDKRTAAIEHENTAIQSKIRMDEQDINTATRHIAATKAGSSEQLGWINAKTEAIRKLNQDNQALNTNNDAIQQNTDKIAENAKTVLDAYGKRLDADEKKFNDSKTLGGKEHAAAQFAADFKSENIQFFNWLYQQPQNVINALMPMYTEWQNLHHETITKNNADTQDSIDKLQENASKLQDTLGGAVFESLTNMMPDSKKYDITFAKDMASFMKERDGYEKQYADMVKNETPQTAAQVQSLRQMLDTWEQVIPLAAQYAYELQKAEDSGLYKGLSKVLDDLASSISNSFVSDMFGDKAIQQQINNLETENYYLEQQKQLEDDAYNASKHHSADQIAEHIRYLNTLKQEEQQIKANQKAEEYRLAHPPLLKKLAQDFTKEMVDSFLKQLEDRLKTSILQKIFGVGKDNPMLQASQKMAEVIQQDATGSMYWNTQQLYDIFIGNANSMANSVQKLQEIQNQTASSASGGNQSFGGPYGAIALSLASGGNPLSSIAAVIGAGVGIGISGGSNSFFNKSGAVGTPGTIDPNLYQAYIAAGMDPATAASMATYQAASGGGFLSGIGGIQGLLGAFGAGYGGYQVAQQGGIGNDIMGGLQGGLGVLAATGNPILAAGVGLFDFFSGMHPNPANEPDIFQTGAWGQANANLWGAGFNGENPMHANGQSFTMDPSLAQATGGLGELQYIAQFIQQNPSEAAKLLTPQQIAEFTGLNIKTPIVGGKNGTLDLANGVQMNWQQLANAANQATEAILQFKDAMNQQQIAMVALNQFGAGMGFFPYNWAVPGYNVQPGNGLTPPVVGTNPPTGTGGSGSGGSTGNPTSGGGPGFGGGQTHTGPGVDYAYRGLPFGPRSSPVILQGTFAVNLDGKILATTVQAYELQTKLAGYDYIT